VLPLAVVAEAFAMIGGEDDQRVVVDLSALELFDQLSDCSIGCGDLAVVRAGVL
jgi:hypothetical protein